MKTIRAFVRIDCVEAVLDALSDLPLLHLTVGHVFALGQDIDGDAGKVNVEFGRTVNKMARVELMCLDRNEGKITEALRRSGCTGRLGDGVIVTSNINHLTEICERREKPRSPEP